MGPDMSLRPAVISRAGILALASEKIRFSRALRVGGQSQAPVTGRCHKVVRDAQCRPDRCSVRRLRGMPGSGRRWAESAPLRRACQKNSY